MEKIPQEKRNLYPKYELQHNGSTQKASADDNATNGFTCSGSSELSDNSGNPELFGFPEIQSCPTIQEAQKSNP